MADQPPTVVIKLGEPPTVPGVDGAGVPAPQYVTIACESCGRSGHMIEPGTPEPLRPLCPRCQAREIMGADPATEAVRAVCEVREKTRHKLPQAPRAKVITRLMLEHGCGLPAAEAAIEKAKGAGYLILEKGLPPYLRVPIDGREGGV